METILWEDNERKVLLLQEDGSTHYIHKTRPVLVWVDVDVGIAEIVESLNDYDPQLDNCGIKTHGSCMGTLDQGGPHPYRPFVNVSWQTEEEFKWLCENYDMEEIISDGPNDPGSFTNCWGYAHPKEITL